MVKLGRYQIYLLNVQLMIMTTYAAFLPKDKYLLEMDVCYLFALSESEQGVAYLFNRLFHDQHFDKI